ncbi:MAG TPA: polysaccharide biosynthesis/export family protein [Pyrinomonadaceae bacterium]|nr:polysaccharide biosynthesis/export family protein [Pyrinomonadaceae bacterium]
MKKLASQSLILVAAVTIATSAFAQSPTNATRQRRSGTDSAQQGSTTQPSDDKTVKTPADDKTVKTSETKTSDAKTSETNAAEAKPSDNKTADSKTADTQTLDVTVTDGKTSDAKTDTDKTKPPPEVTDDARTNRADQEAEEAAIVPYYNNFFTNYRLGPEDVISVNVFQQEKYSRPNIKVPPSGRIYLSLIPEGLFVNGKTPDQVAEMIKQRYDEYIINPQVTVSLDQAGSYRYSVVGDVAVPGIKLMTRRLSVSEAVAEAGGVLATGNRSKVFVLRKQQDGTLKPLQVNLTAVYKGEAPDSIYLVPGDQVIVPGNKLKKWQTIMGFTQVLGFANMFRGGW